MPTLAEIMGMLSKASPRPQVEGLLSPNALRSVTAQEMSYQKWRDDVAPQAESADYNLRGFYNALLNGDPVARGAMGNDGQPHFPDKWKLPNHPTFSRESQYYNPQTMPNTPNWMAAPMSGLPGMGNNFVLRRPDGSIVSVDTPWAEYNPLTNTTR